MKLLVRAVAFLALAALGVWLWLVLFPSPETVVRHHLEKLARRASFSADEGELVRIAGAQRVGDFFADHVDIHIDVPGHARHEFGGRDDITQAAAAARHSLKSLDVKFIDINVTVNADGQTALADLTLEARIGGESDLIVEELQIALQQVNGDWLITRLQTVRVVSPN